jgi:type I restriction enzyme S subunit
MTLDFPDGWKLRSVEDSMKAIIDYRGKTPRKTSSGVPLITAKIVKDGRIMTPTEFIAAEGYDSWMNRGLPEPGDVVMTTEAPLGEIAQLDNRKVALGQRLITLRGKPDVLNNTYLKFAMQAAFVQNQLKARSTGTTILGISQRELRKVEIPLPPLPEQRLIAHILGTLDDKIELNRQMNETLEAIARAIFKSWFVDFDPVRAKIQGRKPDCMDSGTAALFPSAFQDSALGQIPKGWEVDQVKNRASRIQYGFTQSASEKPVGPKFLRITDIASRKLNWASVPFCHITEKDHDKYKLQEGDILVARTGATTGANIYIVDPPDAVFASYLVRIQFHDLSIGRVVGEFMSSQAYDNYVASCIGGSAQPNANAQLLSAVEFVFPPLEIAKRFYEKVHALDKRRAANDRQSVTLSQIRDTLLPKLLSGEIRVV